METPHRFWIWPRRLAVAIAATAALGAGALAVGQFWVTQAGHGYVHTGIDQVPPREIAIVPGVGRARAMRPPASLLPRLRAALALYRAHKVTDILVSGVGSSGSPTDEVVEMQRWLTERGVPAQHILSDPAGLRTLDTMMRASDLLGVRSAVICTQSAFMNRSLFLARSVGIDAVGLVAPAAPLSRQAWRSEALKNVLAIADIHILHTRPRVAGASGVIDGRAVVTAGLN